jgi:hypothetical protein
MSLIALEEHYAWEPVSANNVVGNWPRENNTTAYERLYDRAYPMDDSVRRQVGSENARHLFGDRIPAQNRA